MASASFQHPAQSTHLLPEHSLSDSRASRASESPKASCKLALRLLAQQSPQKCRGSRCINRLAVLVDAGQHEGVAHGARLDQIDTTPQKRFQL